MNNFGYDENLPMTLILNGLRPDIKAIVLQHLPFNNLDALSVKAKHAESALKSYVNSASTFSGATNMSSGLIANATSPSVSIEAVVQRAIEPLCTKLNALTKGAARGNNLRPPCVDQGRFQPRSWQQPAFRPAPSKFSFRGTNAEGSARRCYVCNSPFHLQRNCPHASAAGVQNTFSNFSMRRNTS